jgi:hypothetical protein
MIRIDQRQRECTGLDAGNIHRGKSEAGAAYGIQDLAAKRIAHSPDQICRWHLDPGDVVVMPDSQLDEPELSQRRLGTFDLAEFGRRDRVMMRNP